MNSFLFSLFKRRRRWNTIHKIYLFISRKEREKEGGIIILLDLQKSFHKPKIKEDFLETKRKYAL